jgi:hypothetical protein
MAGQGPTVKLVFAGDADQLDKTMKKVEESGDKMVKGFSLKSAGLALAGGAAAVGLSEAFQNNLDIGAANAKLQAQLGSSTPLAADAGRVAGQLWSNAYGDSLESVNDAVRTVIQSGALMGDESSANLQHVTERALDLSNAFDFDVRDSTNAVAQLMRTGLASSADEAFDVIVTGIQSGVDKSGDFLVTLNEYSTHFRELGLSAKDATGLLIQGLQGGARDSDQVADSLKELVLQIQGNSQATRDAFKSLGFNADEMRAKFATGGDVARTALDQLLDKVRAVHDPVQRSALATAFLGTKAEDLQKALFSLDPSSAVSALGQVDGSAQQLGTTINDTAQNKVTALQRGFQDWVNNLVTAQGPLGDVSGLLVGFGQPALDVAANVGMVALAFRGIGLALFTTAIPAVWSFTAALLANPITWVVLGVIALIAGIVLLITHFDRVKEVATTVIGWIGDRFEWVKGVVSTTAGWVRDRFVDAFNWVRGVAEGVVGWFGSLPGRIGGFFSAIGNGIKNAFRSAFNFVADIWNSTVGRLSITIPSWVPVIGGASFSVPKIPKFHTGGVVPGAPGSEMLAVLQAGETVTPAGQAGGAMVITINSGGSALDDVLVQVFQRAIRDRGGNVQAVLGS